MARADAPVPPMAEPSATAVADPPEAPASAPKEEPTLLAVTTDLLAEIARNQQRMTEMLASFVAAQATPRTPAVGLQMPTARPIIRGDMPTNYVVWLGPEPPNGGEICFRARGRVEVHAAPNVFQKKDESGKTRTLTRTTIGMRTDKYIDAGYTSVEFNRRCPSNHKFANRLFAELECPEHAAYLYLSAPNGRGGDRENHPLFRFFLITPWAGRYERLKQARFNQRKMDEAAVDWVASDGVEMPATE